MVISIVTTGADQRHCCHHKYVYFFHYKQICVQKYENILIYAKKVVILQAIKEKNEYNVYIL